MQAGGGGEQRGGAGRGGLREDLFGALDRALLIEIRRHQPLVQVERVAGGGEDGAAVDDAQRAVHAQAKPFEHGGEVPGIDRLAVDRGLAADRVEPGAVQEGRQQRMTGERLVEPGERRGGLCQGAGQRRLQVFFSPAGRSMRFAHFFPPPADRPRRQARAGEAPPCRALRRRSASNQRLARQATQTGRFSAMAMLLFRPPFPAFVCPISPLVGHGNLGQSGAA